MFMKKDYNSLKRRFISMKYEESLKRSAVYCFEHSSTLNGFIQSTIFLGLVDFLDRNYGINVDDMEEKDVDEFLKFLTDIYGDLIKTYHRTLKLRNK